MSIPGGSANTSRWRWSNFPVPEGHLALLGLSLALSRRWPKPLRNGHMVGWPMVIIGTLLAICATRTAGEADLAQPDTLVVGGPFRWSRNPMYIAWTLAVLGSAPALETRWPLVLSPLLGWWIRREVHREERDLIARFGDDYLRYMERVHRYI